MNYVKPLVTNEKMSDSEQFLLDYINNNPVEFTSKKITEIALQANVSTSTITRFCRKLKYESLKSLQIDVFNKFSRSKENYVLSSESDILSTLNNLKIYHSYAINETLDDLNLESINELVKEIIESKRILIHGIGSSFNACSELSANLEKVGLNTILNRDFHIQLLNLSKMDETDLIILISKSLKSREIRFLIDKAIQNKIPIALITSNKNSKMVKRVDHLITFVTLEQENRITAISSKIAQLLVTDLIFNEVFKKLDKNDFSLIKKGTKIINEWND